MKILIIGANGFLGNALFQYYKNKKDNVFSFSYRPEAHETSVVNIESLIKQNQFDLIVNAGASQNGKDDYLSLKDLINSNILFPSAVTSFIKQYSPQTTLIQFGTSWQIDEKGKDSPFNAYAASKSAAESFLNHFALDGLKVATLRLYETYGPNDKRNKIINLIADALIHKKELSMTGGEQLANFIYIDDVINAVEMTYLLLKNTSDRYHHIYSVKTDKNYTVKEILSILQNISGLNDISFIKLGMRDYRERERFSLFDEVKTIPQWKAKVPLEDGLKKVMQYRRTLV